MAGALVGRLQTKLSGGGSPAAFRLLWTNLSGAQIKAGILFSLCIIKGAYRPKNGLTGERRRVPKRLSHSGIFDYSVQSPVSWHFSSASSLVDIKVLVQLNLQHLFLYILYMQHLYMQGQKCSALLHCTIQEYLFSSIPLFHYTSWIKCDELNISDSLPFFLQLSNCFKRSSFLVL